MYERENKLTSNLWVSASDPTFNKTKIIALVTIDAAPAMPPYTNCLFTIYG